MKKNNRSLRTRTGPGTFKKLQNEWYAKLKASGFADIEKDDQSVRQYSCNAYRQASFIERTTKLAYFLAMESQALGFEFTSGRQKYIILRVCEGAFVSEIVRELKALKTPLDKHTIIRIVRRFEHETGIREWNPKQRHQKE